MLVKSGTYLVVNKYEYRKGEFMFENSKEIMRKIKNKEGLTDAEFTTVERCLLLYEVDDKILDYQLIVKLGATDNHFNPNKMNFEKTYEIISKIRNKEELSKPDRMTLERYLRLYDVSESILNYQVRVDEENPFEITEQI